MYISDENVAAPPLDLSTDLKLGTFPPKQGTDNVPRRVALRTNANGF